MEFLHSLVLLILILTQHLVYSLPSATTSCSAYPARLPDYIDCVLATLCLSTPDPCVLVMGVPRSRSLSASFSHTPRYQHYPRRSRTPFRLRPAAPPYQEPPRLGGTSLRSLEDLGKALGGDYELLYDWWGEAVGVASIGNGPMGEERVLNGGGGTHHGHFDGGFLDGGGEGEGTSQTSLPRILDVDWCCTTKEVYFINSTLTDVYGVQRTIAQYQHVGSFQFVRHGLCGSVGLCYGQCIQKYITVPLVIHPPDLGQTMTSKFFSLPGYCICAVSGSV